MSFDKVIVSSNEDENFLHFLPIVSAAWRKFFPKVKLEVAFVTNRPSWDPLIVAMQEYARVKTFPDLSGYPSANLAKVSRFCLASNTGGVCMIEDIDTVPLQRQYFLKRAKSREKGKLLAVGAEVLKGTEHEGKFPISTMTAESDVFKELINPKNLSFPDLLSTWKNIRIFDHKENILNSASSFSDESLMRALIYRWDKESNKVHHVDRDVDIHTDWIDRSWWTIDEDRLYDGEYITCNFLRPLNHNMQLIMPVIEYIMTDDEIYSMKEYVKFVESQL
jgi:hypothetical protein